MVPLLGTSRTFYSFYLHIPKNKLMPLMAERLCGNKKGLCDHRNVWGGGKKQSKLHTS